MVSCCFNFNSLWHTVLNIFFICLFSIYILSLMRYLFRSFAHFLNWAVHFLIVEFQKFFMYFGYQSFITYDVFCNSFLSILACLDFLNCHRAEVFNFNQVQLINFFHAIVLLVLYLKILQNPRSLIFSLILLLAVWLFCVLHLDLCSILS